MPSFKINEKENYHKASSKDLIQLLSPKGDTPLFVKKQILEAYVVAIVNGEAIHLSGPTGCGKSSFLTALYRQPRNFQLICDYLSLSYKPLKVYVHPAINFETPGELFYRRSINNGQTFDEATSLLTHLQNALQNNSAYHVIWIQEIGRMVPTVTNAFIQIVTNGDIWDTKGNYLGCGRSLAFQFDSNYQAQSEGYQHLLATFDDALKSRINVNLSFQYLSPDQEFGILKKLLPQIGAKGVGKELIQGLVRIGHEIRNAKLKGEFRSIGVPTMRQYFSYLRLAKCTGWDELKLLEVTLLGCSSEEDREALYSLATQVFNRLDDHQAKRLNGRSFY